MNPIQNPYFPGAGTKPAALMGREDLLVSAGVALARLKQGLPHRSLLLVGLRGVGKTVLLGEISKTAQALGLHALWIEAPEGKSLPAMLAPELRKCLLKLDRSQQAKTLAKRALQALAGFKNGLKVKFADIEVGFDYPPEPGLADNGDLELDLSELLQLAGAAAKDAGSGIVILIDELQYVKEPELAALVSALHRCAQLDLPVSLMGAGLPQLMGNLGRAKSYSERLFAFSHIGALNQTSARQAIEIPAAQHSVSFEPQALDQIVALTQGYPYFLQEWGKHAWDCAEQSPITESDVALASKMALQTLDNSFFKVRFDRLTPAEKRYLRAMAVLGEGAHRSGDISAVLNKPSTALAVVRNNLIKKGMIYSPTHGDTAFTVPLFDAYMRRVMPEVELMQDLEVPTFLRAQTA